MSDLIATLINVVYISVITFTITQH